MRKNLIGLIIFSAVSSLSMGSAEASTLPASSCAPDFSSCSVYEDGNVLVLPGLGISGDVVLTDPNTGMISDVFRIFNDFFDSGGGTGLGQTAFLYSNDEGNLPAVLSVNAVRIKQSQTLADPVNNLVETDYNGNGTIYKIFSDAPEPCSAALLGAGSLALAGLGLKRRE